LGLESRVVTTAAASEQYRRKQKFCFSFFFESQQIKITVQAQESTKITSPTTAPKFVVMSRSHKLITLASNTNTQDSIEQARGPSHEEVSSQIFILYVM